MDDIDKEMAQHQRDISLTWSRINALCSHSISVDPCFPVPSQEMPYVEVRDGKYTHKRYKKK